MAFLIQNHISLALKAKKYASDLHKKRNLTYDGKPYSYHLSLVVKELESFRTVLEPRFNYWNLLAAGWLHDTLEDCGISYNDLKKEFGLEIAEIVYAVTNGRGRTREERAAPTYEDIRKLPSAQALKVADRLANVKHSLYKKSKMYLTYKEEYSKFKRSIYIPGICDEMWTALEKIFVEN